METSFEREEKENGRVGTARGGKNNDMSRRQET